MKITARLAGTAVLARLDVSRLVQRVIAEIEHEAQTDVETRPLRRLG